MNSLSDLNILPLMDTSTHDLSTEFFTPLLSNSIRYDRGVGYFSSGWLRINAKGMLEFANNGGRARWVTSPILDEADWEALQTGYTARADPLLRQALEHNIINLARTLEKDTRTGELPCPEPEWTKLRNIRETQSGYSLSQKEMKVNALCNLANG